jgi:hypothetical protein
MNRCIRIPFLSGLVLNCGLVAGVLGFNSIAAAAENPADLSPSVIEVKARDTKEESLADEFGSIGTNPRTGTQMQQRIALYNQALEVSALHAPDSKADDKKKREAIQSFAATDKAKGVEMLLACMDNRNVEQPQTRMGALRALQATKFTHQVASDRLAYTAVNDPDENVRKTAAVVVKENKDEVATARTVKHLMSAYNDGGEVVNATVRNNALAALNAIDDRRVYQALMHYATMELRVANTELANFATRQIDSFTVNNGANATVIVPLSFPIQFPEVAITKVQTTVKCPAVSALEDLTGQHFGNDMDRWRKWVGK